MTHIDVAIGIVSNLHEDVLRLVDATLRSLLFVLHLFQELRESFLFQVFIFMNF